MVLSPLEQFSVTPLLTVTLFNSQWSLTNLSLYAIIAVVLIVAPFRTRTRLVPTRFSLAAESRQATLFNRTAEQVGPAQTRFLPFLGAIFRFILTSNLLGNVPYGFTVGTSLTLARGFSVTRWVGVTVRGFALHRLHYFSRRVPAGCPVALIPVLAFIELISYFARAVSLGVRLRANRVSGHALLKVISGFRWAGLTGPVAALVSLIPRALFVALIGLEIGVSIVQAAVFTMLTSIYLNDALRLHLRASSSLPDQFALLVELLASF